MKKQITPPIKISVCMATYNGEAYIREQLDSILNQDLSVYPGAEMEIIVSDDLSTDRTLEIIKSYNDKRIKILSHKGKKKYRFYNNWIACTRNFGNAMKRATGDFIFLADQDDIWYPNKISKSIDYLKEHGGCLAAGFDIGDANMQKIGRVLYPQEPRWKLRSHLDLYGFSCAFTQEELQSYLPMPSIPHHDHFIRLVSQFKKSYHPINEILAIHRWTGDHNVSSSSEDCPFVFKNWYRLKMVTVAFIRYAKSTWFRTKC